MPGWQTAPATALLILADGTRLEGQGLGAIGHAAGEVCFNTAMTGYQEILTDPSYAGQIITFTFPHIGNVGTNDEDIETVNMAALSGVRGVVLKADITNPSNYRAAKKLDAWLKARNIIGIAGIDTRALTARIRENGMPNGVIAHAPDGQFDEASMQAELKAFPGLEGLDLAKEVTTAQTYNWDETSWDWDKGYGTLADPQFHIVAVDFGAKRNILRRLADQGARVTVVPATATRRGHPRAQARRHLPRQRPGRSGRDRQICRAGDQEAHRQPACRSSASASATSFSASPSAARPSKMHQGHHGANHPVKDLTTGKVEITSMNHGFAVDTDSLPGSVVETHKSLFDGSNCGLMVDRQAGLFGAVPPRSQPRPARRPLPVHALPQPGAQAKGPAGSEGRGAEPGGGIAPDAGAARTPVLQIVLLFVAGLCAAGQFAKVSVLFADLRAVYPDAGAELGFLVSLLSLVGIVLGLFAGLVVARIGFRRLLLVSLAAGAADLALSGQPAAAAADAVEPRRRGPDPGRHRRRGADPDHRPQRKAPPPAGDDAVEHLFRRRLRAFRLVRPAARRRLRHSRSVFVAHAVLLAVVAVLLFFVLPRDGLPGARPGRLSFGEILSRHAEVYTSPAIAAPAAGFVFYTLTFVSLLTLLPDYIDPEWRALTVGAMPLASIAASLISGATLLRRYSAVSVVVAGFGLGAALSLLLIAFPGNPVLCIALFMALGLVQGASFAAIPELNAGAEEQALANGAVAQTGNLGNTFGTPVLLALASAGGFAALAGLVALAHLLGAAIHLCLAPQAGRDHHRGEPRPGRVDWRD